MTTDFWKPVFLGEILTSFSRPPAPLTLPVFNTALKVSA